MPHKGALVCAPVYPDIVRCSGGKTAMSSKLRSSGWHRPECKGTATGAGTVLIRRARCRSRMHNVISRPIGRNTSQSLRSFEATAGPGGNVEYSHRHKNHLSSFSLMGSGSPICVRLQPSVLCGHETEQPSTSSHSAAPTI